MATDLNAGTCFNCKQSVRYCQCGVYGADEYSRFGVHVSIKGIPYIAIVDESKGELRIGSCGKSDFGVADLVRCPSLRLVGCVTQRQQTTTGEMAVKFTPCLEATLQQLWALIDSPLAAGIHTWPGMDANQDEIFEACLELEKWGILDRPISKPGHVFFKCRADSSRWGTQ